MKVTIDFGEGVVREYTVSGSVEQDIRAGKDMLLHTCHPEFGECARVRADDANFIRGQITPEITIPDSELADVYKQKTPNILKPTTKKSLMARVISACRLTLSGQS